MDTPLPALLHAALTASEASAKEGWHVDRVVLTKAKCLLGVWSKPVTLSGRVASAVAGPLTSPDAPPGPPGLWSAIVVEAGGARYVAWDGGVLVRGLMELERVDLRARLDDLRRVLAALRSAVDALRNVKPGFWTKRSGAASWG